MRKKVSGKGNVRLYAFMTGLIIVLFTIMISGNAWSAILISTVEDLQKIGNDPEYPLNGSYELTQDIDASDTVMWNGGAGFQPIGSGATPFTGTFNGKGYVILNLYINRPTENYVGLFGRTSSSATIQNLGIENSVVFGNDNVGNLVGSNEGRTDTCYSNGYVSGENYVGGLVGVNKNTANKCYSIGTVTGVTNVGGLIGSNSGTITQCYSTSAVIGVSNVGGLVGANTAWNASLRRCYALGPVAGGNNVGGLLGSMSWGWIFETYSAGAVSGESNVGGLIGYRFFLSFVLMSYWDTQASGQSSSSGGNGRTTDQMKQQSTYFLWSFGTVWGIVSGVTYPYFIWQYVVPNVIGMTLEDAEQAIVDANFVLGTVTEQCSFTVPEGQIITQSPFGGQNAAPGSAVNVTVSTGPCPTGTVPNVVGMSQPSAENEIIAAGLTVGIITTQCSNTVPAGYVISQDPIGGEHVPPETPVNLVVSTGPCPIPVPDVVGMTEEDADVTLVSAGLFLGTVTEECSNTVPAGRIISQNPPAGAQVPPGSYVNVVKSTGPCGEGSVEGEGLPEGEGIVEGTPEGEGEIEGEFVIAPNVVGQPLVNAVFMINNSQLVIGIITEVCSDEAPFGTIIAQEPLGGTIVEKGSMVNLWISIGPCPPEGEGVVEGTPEGEGVVEGIHEGEPEGIPEGVVEGTPEGVEEGEGEIIGRHSADQDGDNKISLIELLRVIQLFNTNGYHCASGTEDGFEPGIIGDKTCTPHTSDYNPQDWKIDIRELLRLIQIFNVGGYHYCPDEGTEDGFCLGLGGA